MNLYHKEERFFSELCDVEEPFLYPDIPVEMFIKWPEVVVDHGIIAKKFLKEYWILPGKSMYENVDAALLFFRPLAKY